MRKSNPKKARTTKGRIRPAYREMGVNTKINRSFLVIQFENLPYEGIQKYIIVPKSWVRSSSSNGVIAVAYPKEDPARTKSRVENNEECNIKWQKYIAVTRHDTESFKEALDWVTNKNREELRKHSYNSETTDNLSSAMQKMCHEGMNKKTERNNVASDKEVENEKKQENISTRNTRESDIEETSVKDSHQITSSDNMVNISKEIVSFTDSIDVSNHMHLSGGLNKTTQVGSQKPNTTDQNVALDTVVKMTDTKTVNYPKKDISNNNNVSHSPISQPIDSLNLKLQERCFKHKRSILERYNQNNLNGSNKKSNYNEKLITQNLQNPSTSQDFNINARITDTEQNPFEVIYNNNNIQSTFYNPHKQVEASLNMPVHNAILPETTRSAVRNNSDQLDIYNNKQQTSLHSHHNPKTLLSEPYIAQTDMNNISTVSMNVTCKSDSTPTPPTRKTSSNTHNLNKLLNETVKIKTAEELKNNKNCKNMITAVDNIEKTKIQHNKQYLSNNNNNKTIDTSNKLSLNNKKTDTISITSAVKDFSSTENTSLQFLEKTVANNITPLLKNNTLSGAQRSNHAPNDSYQISNSNLISALLLQDPRTNKLFYRKSNMPLTQKITSNSTSYEIEYADYDISSEELHFLLNSSEYFKKLNSFSNANNHSNENFQNNDCVKTLQNTPTSQTNLGVYTKPILRGIEIYYTATEKRKTIIPHKMLIQKPMVSQCQYNYLTVLRDLSELNIVTSHETIERNDPNKAITLNIIMRYCQCCICDDDIALLQGIETVFFTCACSYSFQQLITITRNEVDLTELQSHSQNYSKKSEVKQKYNYVAPGPSNLNNYVIDADSSTTKSETTTFQLTSQDASKKMTVNGNPNYQVPAPSNIKNNGIEFGPTTLQRTSQVSDKINLMPGPPNINFNRIDVNSLSLQNTSQNNLKKLADRGHQNYQLAAVPSNLNNCVIDNDSSTSKFTSLQTTIQDVLKKISVYRYRILQTPEHSNINYNRIDVASSTLQSTSQNALKKMAVRENQNYLAPGPSNNSNIASQNEVTLETINLLTEYESQLLNSIKKFKRNYTSIGPKQEGIELMVQIRCLSLNVILIQDFMLEITQLMNTFATFFNTLELKEELELIIKFSLLKIGSFMNVMLNVCEPIADLEYTFKMLQIFLMNDVDSLTLQDIDIYYNIVKPISDIGLDIISRSKNVVSKLSEI